jgi:hypothetical protein
VVGWSLKNWVAVACSASAIAAGTVPVVGQHCSTTAPSNCTPRQPVANAAAASDSVEPQPAQAAAAPLVGSYVAPPPVGEMSGEGRSVGVRGLGIRIPEIRLELPTVQLPSLVKYRRGPEMHVDSARAPFVAQPAAPFGFIAGGIPVPGQPAAAAASRAPSDAPAATPRPSAPTCTPTHCTSEDKIRQLRREMDAARERILALQDSLEEAVADVEQERALEPVEALEEAPTEYRSSTRQRRLPRESEYDDRQHDYDYGPAAPAYEDEELEPEVQVGTRSRRPAPRSDRDYAERDSAGREYVTRQSASRDPSEPVRHASSAVERASRNYQPEADEYAEQRYRERASAQTRVARTYRTPAVNDGASDYESAPSEPVATRQPPVRYSEARTPTAPRTQASRVIEQEYEEEAAVASVPTPRSLPRPVVTAPKLPTRRSR